MSDQPVRTFLRIGARRTACLVVGVGEIGAGPADPAVEVVDPLDHPGQQPDRLPRQHHRVGGPARDSQRTDRGHRLPRLVGVGAGIGVLDIAVLRKRAAVEQLTDAGPDPDQVSASARRPQFQTAAQLPVLGDLLPYESEQFLPW
ncbi:hypothetical protein [Streptomyces sp. WAC08241]|uniref:hypothetical protein n=1 Tax=Streptomyces sp. WAC08241 TaxID=2487421 RepID=UPI0037DD9774